MNYLIDPGELLNQNAFICHLPFAICHLPFALNPISSRWHWQCFPIPFPFPRRLFNEL